MHHTEISGDRKIDAELVAEDLAEKEWVKFMMIFQQKKD